MDGEKLSRLAGILQQASDVVRNIGIEQPSNLASNASNSSSSSTTSTRTSLVSTSSTPSGSSTTNSATTSIADTLSRARRMMQSSSSAGLYRRLNQNERLRATASSSASKSCGPKSKKAKTEKKPFEFALIKAKSLDDDDEGDSDDNANLKKESIVERGMVELSEDDDEKVIREKLLSSLTTTYSILGPNDFEFVKVMQKKISVLKMAKGTEYNYAVVKKLAGQGLLYIRIKQGYDFVLNEVSTASDDEFSEGLQSVLQQVEQSSEPNRLNSTESNGHHTPARAEAQEIAAISQLEDRFQTVIKQFPSDITEPSEMLRYLQSKVHRGRPLDIFDDATPLEGETNYISVDRQNILQTTFEELKEINDISVTFEVDFYGERAQDQGGPRREWMRLCNQQIKKKYFDDGLKDHLASDYHYAGMMAAIALLQNGQVPRYFSEELLHEIFVGDDSSSRCITEFRRGLDRLGIHVFSRHHQQFINIFRQVDGEKLTVRNVLHVLQPQFSEEGSNKFVLEKTIYSKFVKYVREVAAGRRVTTVDDIFVFTTCTDEIPVLGFMKQPMIMFPEVMLPRSPEGISDDKELEGKGKIPDFIPKANTCANILHLPRPTIAISLPSDAELFEKYDLAFKNDHFGNA